MALSVQDADLFCHLSWAAELLESGYSVKVNVDTQFAPTGGEITEKSAGSPARSTGLGYFYLYASLDEAARLLMFLSLQYIMVEQEFSVVHPMGLQQYPANRWPATGENIC